MPTTGKFNGSLCLRKRSEKKKKESKKATETRISGCRMGCFEGKLLQCREKITMQTVSQSRSRRNGECINDPAL
ncbi:hypothetical protein GW17_00045643 [Ensete ventricosum]|nr:hypothetical protein GW17_00045643 [Ensete ventricosum]